MPLPAGPETWTVEMLDALPDDGQRREIIDGVLYVTPAPFPPHQMIVGELHVRLHEHLRGQREARAFGAASDIRRGDRDSVQPDVFVVRLVGGQLPPYPFRPDALLLAVEVLSPSTHRVDRTAKRDFYLRTGVPEYWVIDGDAREVTRWRRGADDGTVHARTITWESPGLAPLTIDLPAFFAEALLDAPAPSSSPPAAS